MKSIAAAKEPSRRAYRQTARAEAAEATGRRIIDAFIARIRDHWFEDVTLDAVARDAGVTVQTVVRRFGGKEGLLGAAEEVLKQEVRVRRLVEPGNIDHMVEVLSKDYEIMGDLITRLLAQEERHSGLRPLLELGRREHREWLAEVFAAELEKLPRSERDACLDALVAAADVYVWKLFRRDLGRSVRAYKNLAANLLRAVLTGAAEPLSPKPHN